VYRAIPSINVLNKVKQKNCFFMVDILYYCCVYDFDIFLCFEVELKVLRIGTWQL
jgi:hypothetical protein